MNTDPQQEANQVRAIVHARKLGDCDEKALRSMLSVLQMYQASGQPQMAAGVIESVENEIHLRQREGQHKESLAEIGEIKKAQLSAAAESERKSEARHKEAMKQSVELHHKTQKVAWIAVWVAAIGVAAAITVGVVQYFENKVGSSGVHSRQP
jgi:hypothetical protein